MVAGFDSPPDVAVVVVVVAVVVVVDVDVEVELVLESVVVVVVAADAAMVMDQPPEMLPAPPAASSITNSDHTPLGFSPLNSDSAEPYGPPGAGESNGNDPPLGLYDVDDSALPAGAADIAASSKTSVKPVAA